MGSRLLAVVVVALPGIARAEAPNEDSVLATARQNAQLCHQLVEKKEHAKALPFCVAADAEAKNPRVAHERALAEAGLGKLLDAAASCRRALGLAGDARFAGDVELARQLLALLEQRTPRLEVVVSPLGASPVVLLDERAVERPEKPTAVDPGAHRLRVTAQGFAGYELTLSLEERSTTRHVVHLNPLPVVPPPAVVLPPADERPAAPGGPPAWAWAGFAGAVAFTGVAVGLGVGAQLATDEFYRTCPDAGAGAYCATEEDRVRADGLRRDIQAFMGLSIASGVVAAAGLGIGIAGVALAPERRRSAGRPSFGLGVGHASVRLVW